MSDPIRTNTTGPLYRPQPAPRGTAPLASPGQSPQAPAARMPGDQGPAQRPGTSGLRLPNAAGDLGNAAARLAAASGEVQAVTDGTQSYVDMASGAADAASGLKEGARIQPGRAQRAVDSVADFMGEGTRLGTGMVRGGAGLGALGGAAQVAGAFNTLAQGETQKGSFDLAGGLARVGEGAGMLAQSVGPASRAAAAFGARGVPLLGAASGVAQIGSALSSDPADLKTAATGAMTAVGSAAMMFPPAGTVVGGALVATAAIIDNWDTISSAASTATTAVSDAASKVASWFGF